MRAQQAPAANCAARKRCVGKIRDGLIEQGREAVDKVQAGVAYEVATNDKFGFRRANSISLRPQERLDPNDRADQQVPRAT